MDEVMKDTVTEVTDEVIRDWKVRYGKVYKLAADDEDITLDVYIKKPTRAAISRFQSGTSGKKSITEAAQRSRFQSGTSGKKSITEAAQRFLFDLLLYPSQDELVKIFEEKPGLPTALVGEIGDLVGITANFTTTEL